MRGTFSISLNRGPYSIPAHELARLDETGEMLTCLSVPVVFDEWDRVPSILTGLGIDRSKAEQIASRAERVLAREDMYVSGRVIFRKATP